MNKNAYPIQHESKLREPAETVRQEVRTLVEDSPQNTFPDNHQQLSTYNRVFTAIEGVGDQQNGFFEEARMLTIDPDGEIRSGLVAQEVKEWSSGWNFSDADMQPASDLEVLEYGPLVIEKLFSELARSATKQEDPVKIEAMIDGLGREIEVMSSVLSISLPALKAYYGDHYTSPLSAVQSIEGEVNAIFAELGAQPLSPENKTLAQDDRWGESRLRAAFELTRDGSSITNEMTKLHHRKGKSDQALVMLKKVIEKAGEAGLFTSSNAFKHDGQDWVGTNRFSINANDLSTYRKMRLNDFRFVVSASGDVRLQDKIGTIVTPDPRTVRSGAASMANSLIQKISRDYFPAYAKAQLK
jgi:hypothetical protein